MCGIKTLLACILIAAPLCAQADGLPSSPVERLRIFTDCAGRLSALEEQQRMFDGPSSEKTAQLKMVFDDLIAATLPDAQPRGISGKTALHWQVNAKMAQAVLLQTAVFGTSADRAARAGALADQYLTSCRRLILGV